MPLLSLLKLFVRLALLLAQALRELSDDERGGTSSPSRSRSRTITAALVARPTARPTALIVLGRGACGGGAGGSPRQSPALLQRARGRLLHLAQHAAVLRALREQRVRVASSRAAQAVQRRLKLFNLVRLDRAPERRVAAALRVEQLLHVLRDASALVRDVVHSPRRLRPDHPKVELIRIPIRRLDLQLAQPPLLLVVVLRALQVVLLLLQQPQLCTLRRLTPLPMLPSSYRVAEVTHPAYDSNR